jgi:hypothetical protein
MSAKAQKDSAKPRKPAPDPRQQLGISLDDTIPTKPAIGRPTTYHPSYCQRVIELGKQGYSPCQIACELETDRETIIGWTTGKGSGEDGPRFATSLARAKLYEQAWWEERGRKGLDDRHFNAHLWVKIMTCRFRQDYSDRVELTGQDGGPILFQTVYEEPPKTIDVTPSTD